MLSWKFYHNPQCSKSREALSLLEAEGQDFQIIDYIKEPLSVEDLLKMIAQLRGPLSSLVRAKEADFFHAPFDLTSAEEVALRLSEKPHLMERPILQGKGSAVIGRPLENLKALLKGQYTTQPAFKFLSFPGKIHLINTDQELQAIALALESHKELGFDTETRPAFKKGESYPVALLQLATDTDAYIIRLKHIKNIEVIKNIFENPAVAKVGAAIRDDLKQLQKRFHFQPHGFIELQTVAKNKNLKNIGLKGMTEEVLQATITKGPKTTNWEAQELTEKQILYAATDAWIGLKLYQKLTSDP
ncbi:ArsC/Spx/MgsR family protein [Bdellovibrio svalbardensis]|uniref:3'-5' exonuclease n=1 Tax=Bdellovibrio svalbardensis TaxID=2972972 RepID=A0ABT6DK65_9BACT|nr:ArsC/Spx/MgsR family protein [Bdellovibrio svalbardensis]MDG0817198.1 hypothetical protein [Bdellovibrio svalbardensis]